MTSSDILDTSLTIMCRESIKVIKFYLSDLLYNMYALLKKDYINKNILSRTHGKSAEIQTYYEVFTRWIAQLQRGYDELTRLKTSISFGKLSGPSGNYTTNDKPYGIGKEVYIEDVSIQADILNLLKQLQQVMGLTFLFISHDLSVVAHTCDHVAVMYLGRLVEVAPTRKLFASPRHPYTKALFSAIPSLNPEAATKAQKLEGEIPSPSNMPVGCKFHSRCPHAIDDCRKTEPSLMPVDGDHEVACFRWKELFA